MPLYITESHVFARPLHTFELVLCRNHRSTTCFQIRKFFVPMEHQANSFAIYWQTQPSFKLRSGPNILRQHLKFLSPYEELLFLFYHYCAGFQCLWFGSRWLRTAHLLRPKVFAIFDMFQPAKDSAAIFPGSS